MNTKNLGEAMKRMTSAMRCAVWAMLGLAALSGCSSSSRPESVAAPRSGTPGWDRSCDEARFPSLAWTQCELLNYAHVSEAPTEQLQPAFVARLSAQSLSNQLSWLARAADDPSWLALRSANTELIPLCTTWALPCVGDPFRYAQAEGLDGAPFYTGEAEVIPVVYYDQDCARISGRIWAPRNRQSGASLPGVVIENGSVQASETLYWWAAQLLVRAGYVVMTSDPRGQGRSDWQSPSGQQGGNLNVEVFTSGLVNAIDFFRSSSVQPYPHNQSCAGTYPTVVTAFNPLHAAIDPARLGIAGHSAGANAVHNVQAFGASGAAPWPGLIDAQNPVRAAVAWDSTFNPNISLGGLSELPGVAEAGLALTQTRITLQPHLPLLEQQSEYGLVPTPFLTQPAADSHLSVYQAWRAQNLPVMQVTLRGSTHYEWSLLPAFPASSWCPQIVDGRCSGGWGQPLAQHYTLAWFDRWLKQPGEAGYADADARLLDDASWADRMSFHFHSARSFVLRDGQRADCADIRAGC
ncbi:hypothetical protein SAMN04488038_11374 [Solimonas aquatica]|uniref:Alpha/beta hydrolase family protein n=1 Tax=Solimonas aquatica TaxID=489703 RepID=A0A1H9KEH7_9GAMM|nr:hypothetical protein SAMN04488038_11374 [Solimonas aquatica]